MPALAQRGNPAARKNQPTRSAAADGRKIFESAARHNLHLAVAESPIHYVTNAKTPTLIHVGDADQRVPKPQSDELFMALKKLGVPVEYIVYPGMPHGISEPRYQMVKMVSEFNWMEKWVMGKPGWLDWKPLLATLDEPKGPAERAADKAGDDQP